MRELKSIHDQQEKETLIKIKQKVEQIRISQQKIERNIVTAKTHSDGTIIIYALLRNYNPYLQVGKYQLKEYKSSFHSYSIQRKIFVRGFGREFQFRSCE